MGQDPPYMECQSANHLDVEMVIVTREGLYTGDIRIVKIDLRAVGVRQKVIYKQLG